MCIDTTIKHWQDVLSYFEKYRKEDLTKSLNLAKSLALQMKVEPTFPTKCHVNRKKDFGGTMRNMKISHQKNYFYIYIYIYIGHIK